MKENTPSSHAYPHRPAKRRAFLLSALLATAGALALACGQAGSPPAPADAPAGAPGPAASTDGTAGQQPGKSGVIDENTPPAPQKPPAETLPEPEPEEPGKIKGG
jgi:hypothetical protein